ncbi:MAG: hypothetical protein ACYCS1_09245 [Gammaproteobacteria bacterium]
MSLVNLRPRLARALALALLFFAGPTPAHARSWSVWGIVDGISHHVRPSVLRGLLNQDQHSLGVDIQHGPWTFEFEHLTDSFSCSSYAIAAGRRWRWIHAGWFKAGAMAAAMLAWKCRSFTYQSHLVTAPYPPDPPPPGGMNQISVCQGLAPPGGTVCTSEYFTFSQPRHRHLVPGLVPGLWAAAGPFQIQLGILLTGGNPGGSDAVLYTQLLIHVWSFK